MPHVIDIKVNDDYERHTIMGKDDMIELIGQHMGWEFASLIEQELRTPDIENMPAEWKEAVLETTDYYSYESSLEDNQNSFQEIEECSSYVSQHLRNDKRINRYDLLKHVDRINSLAVLSL